MHNIAEGFDSGSNPEFIRFMKMARRSASEVQSQLYLALDRKYITTEELKTSYDIATEGKTPYQWHDCLSAQAYYLTIELLNYKTRRLNYANLFTWT